MDTGAGRVGAASVVVNGKAYVGLGGTENLFGDVKSCFDDFYEYDPTTDKWTKKASLGFPGVMNCAFFGFDDIDGGTIYALMGQTANGIVTSDCFVYTISTNTWKKLTTVKRPYVLAVASTNYFKSGNNAYIMGGKNASTLFSSLVQFDPLKIDTNPWTTLNTNTTTDLGERGTSFSVNKKIYGIYGSFNNKIVEYDPATKQFKTDKTDPFGLGASGRYGCMSFVISGQGFVFGGNKTGGIALSDVWSFGDPVVATKDLIDNNLKIDINYNTVSKNLEINTAEAIKTIEIYNINGQLIQSNQERWTAGEKIEKDCSQLNQGIYIIRINTLDNKSKAQKINIQ
jgi:N-acetylneuraminic acid mutarotase